MNIAIISTALAIVLFLCSFTGFKQGLRLGMNTAKGEVPKPIKNPIKAVKEFKEDAEQAKATKKHNEDLERLMTYTGDINV